MEFRLVHKAKLLCPELDISLCRNTILSWGHRQTGCLMQHWTEALPQKQFASVPPSKLHMAVI